MNYILSNIDKKIKFQKTLQKKQELKVLYQSKVEFYLTFMLGYLWNKNLQNLPSEDKEFIVNCILKPSIGSIVGLLRKLDENLEFFGNKKLKKFQQAINDYPMIRNVRIGHGYSFEDGIDEILLVLENIIETIEESDISLFNDCDLILVINKDDNLFQGINFKSDGGDYSVWTCPKTIYNFNVGDLYLLTNTNDYFRLSPFVRMNEEGESFIFCSIDEKLTGRTKFNQLIKTGILNIDLKEFGSIVISQDNYKKKTSNGTIINVFNNNYNKYIEVGTTKSIIDFLTKNKSSVFATLWGHGGVGKTASIQNVCEMLCNKETKDFDYILFLSAKDRLYNYYKGKIEDIEEKISTLEQIIKYSNRIIYNEESIDETKIIEYNGKLLFIIDDFETFSKDEKQKITDFIKRLDINKHKVIITTRAATLITGEEIKTGELNVEQTIEFLKKALEIELSVSVSQNFTKELNKRPFQEKIHEITSGRPLFILQFAILLAQKSSVQDAVLCEINNSDAAKNFLYNRIYEYLSLPAKNLFLAISLLVTEEDLSGLVENLKFIVNKEDLEEEFQLSLNELVKLKIVVLEDKFFKVYSVEVYRIMKLHYDNKGEEFDGNITNRFNLLNNSRNVGTEMALLENADASRLLSPEVEVENNYKYILKRSKSPKEIKLKALLNFASYLFTTKGKVDKAVKLFDDYFHIFSKNPEFISKYSAYLWATGETSNRYKAVDIIKNYFSTKPVINSEIYLEFLGTIMMYVSILLVNERDELKIQKRFNEISKENYEIIYQEQRNRFFEIYKYPGLRLYSQIKTINLKELSPNCRNYVLDGLTHFVEICIRTRHYDIGKEICLKVFDELTENYHKPFVFKISKIESLENPEERIAESDLAIKLKEALNNK